MWQIFSLLTFNRFPKKNHRNIFEIPLSALKQRIFLSSHFRFSESDEVKKIKSFFEFLFSANYPNFLSSFSDYAYFFFFETANEVQNENPFL
jgi:hypothetical protein